MFVSKALLRTHSWKLNALPKDTSCGEDEGGASGATEQPLEKQRLKNEGLLIVFTFLCRKLSNLSCNWGLGGVMKGNNT